MEIKGIKMGIVRLKTVKFAESKPGQHNPKHKHLKLDAYNGAGMVEW